MNSHPTALRTRAGALWFATPRGVVVSDRHPYLFSCGEDKEVKCWDLEQNKVIRNYHGHLRLVAESVAQPYHPYPAPCTAWRFTPPST